MALAVTLLLSSVVSLLLSMLSKAVPSEGRPRGKLLDLSLFSGGRRPAAAAPGGGLELVRSCRSLGLLEAGGGGRRGILDCCCWPPGPEMARVERMGELKLTTWEANCCVELGEVWVSSSAASPSDWSLELSTWSVPGLWPVEGRLGTEDTEAADTMGVDMDTAGVDIDTAGVDTETEGVDMDTAGVDSGTAGVEGGNPIVDTGTAGVTSAGGGGRTLAAGGGGCSGAGAGAGAGAWLRWTTVTPPGSGSSVWRCTWTVTRCSLLCCPASSGDHSGGGAAGDTSLAATAAAGNGAATGCGSTAGVCRAKLSSSS